jgi:UDP-N-acetylmuramyl pentapeptide phosphotransferase/UDP-N-acetylglucosamine-1-phosphate transferase
MLFLAIAVAALALTIAALVCTSLLASPPAALLRTNFHGKEIPVIGGLVIVSGLLAGEVALAVTYLLDKGGRSAVTFASRDHWGLLVAALGFFAVGLLDDLAGSGHSRGFRGHLRAIARGELSTGAIKALGGAAIGLIVGALWEGSLGPALLDAGIVALSANIVNLLDLRPGRAAKAFLIAWGVLAAATWGSAYVVLSLPVAAATLLWLAPDLTERGMLGDVGANLLGAVLGAGVALSLTVRGRLVVLLALVVLTAASERWSFSRAINKVPPLRWLDRIGRTAERGEARG